MDLGVNGAKTVQHRRREVIFETFIRPSDPSNSFLQLTSQRCGKLLFTCTTRTLPGAVAYVILLLRYID